MISAVTIVSIREAVCLRMRGVFGGPAGELPVCQFDVSRPFLRAARFCRAVTGTVLGGVPGYNRSEPLGSRSGVTGEGYREAVDRKVREAAARIEAGEQPDGWNQGLRHIIIEMIDETLDISGWACGRERYEVPEKVEARILRAIDHAAEAYAELQLALRELDRS